MPEGKRSTRFDYIAYDTKARGEPAMAKEVCEMLERHIESLGPSRAQSLALTKLEECYIVDREGDPG